MSGAIVLIVVLGILFLYVGMSIQEEREAKKSSGLEDKLKTAYHAGFEAGIEKGKADLISEARAFEEAANKSGAVEEVTVSDHVTDTLRYEIRALPPVKAKAQNKSKKSPAKKKTSKNGKK